jgi:Ser/Thr protein kinase RdoA (MazF antagonist)
MRAQPFAGLTPETVLDALDSIGMQGDGRLLSLNSYENRVYQAGLESGPPIVAKFYRPGRWGDSEILEEHAFVCALADHEIPAVPPLLINGRTLHSFDGFRFSVSTRQGGRAPELDDRETLKWMGRFIGRIHAVGAIEPYRHRPALDIETFGVEPSAFLLEHGFIPGDLADIYKGVVAQALDGVRRSFDRANSGPLGAVRKLRLHGDCHVGNVLWGDAGPHFVDFDDSRMGPAIQDMWMLLSGTREEMARQLSDLLAGYGDFCAFDVRELQLVEALRTLRLIHYSGWIARRWDDPAFSAAFPWFTAPRYWEERILELKEQIALMDEPALCID